MAILPVGLSAEASGYQIERSLRFNSADSAYLNRTPASAGNRKTWTWSGWVKRGASGDGTGSNHFFLFSANSANPTVLDFYQNTIRFYTDGGAYLLVTSQVFRDYSAWYHIVAVADTTQATASNRLKIYVNGVQVTVFSTATYPTQNLDTGINTTTGHFIGKNTATNYFSGYLAEVHFIDGQALTPSSFGETDSDTGVWKPKAYSGSYGTNGFYLDFGDNSSTTALGYDAAGSNDWTPNNFSVTAGAGNDSLVDSPTRYGTDTGVGGEVRGNYATLNPLSKSSYISLANGNLDSSGNTSADEGVCGSTIAVKTGKWYAEFTVTGSIVSNRPNYGIIPNAGKNFTNGGGDFAVTAGMRYGPDGKVYTAGSLFGTFSTFTTGDVIGVAIDSDNGAAYVSKNGTWQNSGVPTSGASKTGAVVTWTGGSVEHFFAIDEYNGSTSASNFGARPFAYTAPSGFKALCTTNLPEPTIAEGKDYFNAVTYAGSASQQTIDSGLTALDFAWIKNRTTARDHVLVDTVRGGSPMLTLYSSATYAEDNTSPNYNPTSISGGGIVLGGAKLGINNSGENFVLWGWKANGAGVSNTAGTISSTVSANTTAGFSIVTYTGTQTSNQTVGHGLGVAPSMIIAKYRDGSGPNWVVYHSSIGRDYTLVLNNTDAKINITSYWGTSNPTSTVFGVGQGNYDNNKSGGMVAYCFSAIAGYSAFGSFVGSGSADGPFIFTGFRPAFVMTKKSSNTGDWYMWDDKRIISANGDAGLLYAQSSLAESDYNAAGIDLLSNGFKIRNADSSDNGSGDTIIYMAFAENPFKYSLAR